MKKLVVLIILSVLLIIGCDDDESNEPAGPISLVPQSANLMAYVDLPRILDELDMEGIIEEIPKEEDDPQTLQEALDLLGMDEIGEAVIFGDVSDMAGSTEDISELSEGYFGLIIMGTFNEEQLIDTIEAQNENEMTTTTHKGYTIYTDPEEEVTLTFLDTEAAVLGTPKAVKDVIEIREGDQSAIEGGVLDTYNDLGTGIIKLAMTMPDELRDEMNEEMGEDDMMGLDPLSFIKDLETIGLVVDIKGDSIPIDGRICFANAEAAENMKGMLGFMLAMFSFEDMEVAEEDKAAMELLETLDLDLDGTCIVISLEATSDILEDLAGSMEDDFMDDLGGGLGEGLGFGMSDNSENDIYDFDTELIDVELAVADMMYETEVPVFDLDTDERILDFAGTEAEATNDMSNGGLITIVEGSDLKPVSEHLLKAKTINKYWLDADGWVYQVED